MFTNHNLTNYSTEMAGLQSNTYVLLRASTTSYKELPNSSDFN